MMKRSSARQNRLLLWLAWFAFAVVLTAVLLLLRATLDKAHVALLLLLPVLGGAAQVGRRLGFALATFTFLCFNFFFLPPHYTFVVADPFDWLVLGIYFITGSVAAQLLHRARSEAEQARKLAESETALREADRVKDALLAAVSHDLRTPLTTIKAIAHDLAEKGVQRAGDIEAEADGLNALVSDLLDLSRLKTGAMPVRMEINAAEDLIGAAIEQVSRALGDREIRVSLDTTAPLLVGRFDFVHALRIIVNLLENAHKYSPPGTPIELSAYRSGKQLGFSVADHGTGIATGEAERIYEPFYRVPGSRHDRGAGLGLSIARQLAQLQRGTVRHEARPGGGTTFFLELPAAEVEGGRGDDAFLR